MVLAALMVFHHVLVWRVVSAGHGLEFSLVLARWDAGHYADIVRRGYQGTDFAFLPLFPLTVRALWKASGEALPVPWTGALLSLALFAAFVWLAARHPPCDGDAWGLAPRTAWGWFAFLYSPASYVFHSNHTESLFLLGSYGAFRLAWERRWAWAAVASGLCLLTRNQGAFVWLAASALALLREEGGRARLRAGVGCALIGGAFLAGLLTFQYVASGGDALAFLHAQKAWRQAESLADVARVFGFGHPWQRVYLDSVIHHALWFALALLALLHLRRQRWPLALYVWASLAVMPLQLELINVYRYGTVLFPALFLLGDGLARVPLWLRLPAAAACVWFNNEVTYLYALGRWAY